MKYVILTATRTLEDQAVADGFDSVNVRGKSNYECSHRHSDEPGRRWSCEDGEKENCPHAGTKRCTSGAQVELARCGDSIITNYQYWLNARCRNRGALENNNRPDGISGKIGMLIMDEAHRADQELSRFLGIWVSDADLHRWANKEIRLLMRASNGAEWGKVTAPWVEALDSAQIRLAARLDEIVLSYHSQAHAMRADKDYKRLSRLADNLERVLSHADDNNWLWRVTRSGLAFDCIWPGRYAEQYLWSGVERVVVMSGTLRPKTLNILGLRASEYHYKEFPAVFAPQESPVYWVPTGKMGHGESEQTKLLSVARLDEMAEEWHNYKGIVHTNSYVRAEWVMRNSRHSAHMILSTPGEANAAADRYRTTAPPVMLVSPSFTTGWDFAEEQMSWSLINKLPFPDRSDAVVCARADSDDQWYNYETMQTLVQECGRQKRRAGQRTVTVITDDAIKGFRHYAKAHSPRSFAVLDAPGGRIPHAPR